jgi:sphingomyelin phosphodiesterase
MNGELAWLIEELLAAEANGELVHIINHIPPGNADCLGAWGREYAKIIDRLTIVEN